MCRIIAFEKRQLFGDDHDVDESTARKQGVRWGAGERSYFFSAFIRHWEKILKLSAWNVTETSWEGLRGRLRGNDQKCGVYRCHLMLGGSNALKTQPSLTTLQIYFSAISLRKVRFEESPLPYQRRSSALCRAKSTGSYNGTSSERSKNSSCAENGPEMHEKIIFSVRLEKN